MAATGLKLHDTLTGNLVEFEPAQPGLARVYCCGPTTYDVAHVGHARAALAPDVLVRHLRSKGLEVRYVRNITDVDDKILARAKERGEEPTALSARMAALYQEDVTRLGCLSPTVEPKVSEHIPHIVRLVRDLLAKGAAYSVDLGEGVTDVYYAVRAFPSYGKLSGRQVDDMRVGARVEASDKKRDPLDFALWKGCPATEWGWDTELGRGRPGWHIECSAMSEEHLGYGFDVHAGGMDLVFPHHENEIAQSEAAHAGEGQFARVWIHNGFVNVDKEKMAKSLGNFVTLRDVYERNDPEALRYFLLGVQYRGPIAFDTEKRADGRVVFPGVVEAERRVDYLYGCLERLEALATSADGSAPTPKELDPARKLAAASAGKLAAALDDDLNTPVALGVIAELAKASNEVCDLAERRRKDARFGAGAARVASELRAALVGCLAHVGLLSTPAPSYRERTRAQRLRLAGLEAADVEAKLTARAEARDARDFARADALRAELTALGVEVLDTPTGSAWRLLA